MPYHRRRVADGGEAVGWLRGPLIGEEPIARSIPEDVVDGTVRASIENVLLIPRHHGCRITRSGGGAGYLCPLIAEELIARCVPENMVNGAVGASIENVLLIRPSPWLPDHQQRRRRRAVGESIGR